MRPRRIRAQAGAGAFTLVELLAAVAVTVLLGFVLAQITTSIRKSTRHSAQVIDAATQARAALDCLAFDLAGLIRRADTDFQGLNLAGAQAQPLLLFLTSNTPTSGNRGLSVVSYEVNVHPENLDAQGTARACLVRGAKAIPWRSGGAVPANGFMGLQSNGLPLSFAALPAALTPTAASDFQVLAPGAIRMVVAYQLYPDNQAVKLMNSTYIPTPNASRGQIVYNPPKRTLTGTDGSQIDYADLSRVASIIVGLVVLDNGTLPLVTAQEAQDLGAAFVTPADGANVTPLQAWAPVADAVGSLPAGVPLPARQALRVYERAYPVTPFPSPNPQ